MNKYKRMMGFALGASVCAAVAAAGQSVRSPDIAPHIAGVHSRQQAARIAAEAATMDGMIGHLDKAAQAALDAGKFAEAEEDAQQSLSLGHDSGLAQKLLAQALYAQGKDQEALQAYKAISDMGPNDAHDEWPYALLLLKSGHWAQAVEAYNTALTLGGDTDVLRANTRFSPAVPEPRDLETAIHIGLGMTGDFRGHYWHREKTAADPTLSDFHKALELEPDNPVTHYYYGHGLLRLGHREEAKAAFAKAAAMGGDDIKAAVKRFSP